MDDATKNFFYHIFFRLEMYKRSGEEFQIFFSDIMNYTDPNFIKVAPFGGDGGNDGCDPNKGHYYQIYSPRPTTSVKLTHSTVLQKSITDFHKLNEHWNNLTGLPKISEYFFVYNDRFQGIPTDIVSLLANLKKTHDLNNSACIYSNQIEDKFADLPEDKKLRLLGRPPISEAPFEVDPSALGQLLQHLSTQSVNTLGFLEIDAPIWNEKIHFNSISSGLNNRLTDRSHQGYRVKNFLSQSKTSDAQEISQQVNRIYKESKSFIPDSLENYADMRYFWMVDRLIPSQIFQENNLYAIKAYRDASEIILAHYFDTCDVYDNPN
ncbi:ABC-three component system protein [Acinetobacter pittii]|uniref:ABC-three component system protein n=1 Tax=Acinetobacter pittii TaxID=48296 RepID=UPI0026F79E11|nr:ABC-three component system protein [Acinetobacter pittii]MDO7536631.1 hypothetical protein [Acinetobacter pittii]